MALRSTSLARVLGGTAAVLALALLWAAAGPPPAAAEEAPGQIVINRLPGPKTSTFDHAAHAKQAPCTECHHTGKNVACGSSGCHPAKAAEAGPPDLKTAFHKQCIPCHGQHKAATKCAGPGTCHGPA